MTRSTKHTRTLPHIPNPNFPPPGSSHPLRRSDAIYVSHFFDAKTATCAAFEALPAANFSRGETPQSN